MLKANYHTHTILCGHADGNVEDYVNEAVRLGFKELGMSDHAHTPESFMSKYDYERNGLVQMMSDNEFENIYKLDVLKAKERKDIKVYLGLETEYLEEHYDYFENLRKKVDYLVLGMHFFSHGDKILSTYDDIDCDTLEIYTDTAIKAMSTGLYKIFAHPDLFMYSYNSKKGFRVFDEACEKCSIRLIEASVKYNMYIEVNAQGIRNTYDYYPEYTDYLYPREEFWELASKTDAKIVIGADAHSLSALNDDKIDEAIAFAEKMNLKLCDFVKID